jgi:hypothetical protein
MQSSFGFAMRSEKGTETYVSSVQARDTGVCPPFPPPNFKIQDLRFKITDPASRANAGM